MGITSICLYLNTGNLLASHGVTFFFHDSRALDRSYYKCISSEPNGPSRAHLSSACYQRFSMRDDAVLTQTVEIVSYTADLLLFLTVN